MRYLAIDLGMRRTGLAVGDDGTGIVTPLQVIDTTDENCRLAAIADAIEDQGPDALVVGLPVNMDGSEGSAARLVRAIADQFQRHFGLPLHLVDERLTSFAAEQQLNQSGLTHRQKKQTRDALAAANILRDFLERPDNDNDADA